MTHFRVISAGLNLRHTPTATTNDNLFPPPLVRGDIVEKIDETPDRRWFQVQITQDGITREGWVASRNLVEVDTQSINGSGIEPAWLTIAKRELGVQESEPDNPRILEYLATTTNLAPHQANQDETDWCSAFVNWCMTQAGYTGTNHALARSWWNNWPGGVKSQMPEIGCIVVFRRLINGIDTVSYTHLDVYKRQN